MARQSNAAAQFSAARIRALDASLPIVVMTGWGTVEVAVEAMRRGVRDFVQKPWDNSRLLQTLDKQVRHARAKNCRKSIGPVLWQLLLRRCGLDGYWQRVNSILALRTE